MRAVRSAGVIVRRVDSLTVATEAAGAIERTPVSAGALRGWVRRRLGVSSTSMAASPEPDDLSLLAAWRGGDRPAGNAFVNRHFATVYAFLRRRLPDDAAAAKDLAQRTFLACLEAGEAFAPTGSVRVYLVGIARNMLLRYFRERRPSEAEATLPGAVTSPSRAFVRAEESELVRASMAQLPESLRTTLELHYWEELPVAEIAVLLEVAPGTVKWRLHEGRKQLRALIERAEVGVELRAATLRGLASWE